MSILKSRSFKYLLSKESLPLVLLVLVCLGVSSYLGYLLPQLIADLFEKYDGEGRFFFEIIKVLLFIHSLEYANRVIYTTATSRFVQKMLLRVRVYCYREWICNHEIQHSKKEQKEFPLGEVLARLMNDTEAIRELVASGSFAIFVDMIFVISCLVSFIEIDRFSGSFLMGLEIFSIVLLLFGSRSLAKIF